MDQGDGRLSPQLAKYGSTLLTSVVGQPSNDVILYSARDMSTQNEFRIKDLICYVLSVQASIESRQGDESVTVRVGMTRRRDSLLGELETEDELDE